jgi:hypothetical protein
MPKDFMNLPNKPVYGSAAWRSLFLEGEISSWAKKIRDFSMNFETIITKEYIAFVSKNTAIVEQLEFKSADGGTSFTDPMCSKCGLPIKCYDGILYCDKCEKVFEVKDFL